MKPDKYAEDLPYWKTSQTSPDAWLEKAKRCISGLGGRVLLEAFGNEPVSGRAAFMLGFEAGGDKFKVVWPVLPSRAGNERAARIQAATMLYHDVKARCLTAAVLGTRSAFFSYYLLPDGRTATEAATPELAEAFPKLLVSG